MRERGFTLLDLLIVLAIVWLLAAMVVPAWNAYNANTVILSTDDWRCLQAEEREYSYSTLVGRMPVTRTGRREECVQWRRRDAQ